MEDNQAPVLSQAAVDAMRLELDELKTSGRQKMGERLRHARELGDVSDNADFESAKHDQALMEGRIAKLEATLKHAVVRDTPSDASSVVQGVKVTVRDVGDPSLEDEFVIADSEERASGARVLSPQSPLGRALLGKTIGDHVTYQAPGGTFTYEVVKLEPGL